MSILRQEGLRQRVPCLQPAFTLDYTKWSLLAGPGRAVGAVIVSSPAAGDLLQALPALLSAPCVVHLHQHTLPPREKGQGSTREQGGCAGERPQSLCLRVSNSRAVKLSLTSPGLSCACSLRLSQLQGTPSLDPALGISQGSPASLWEMEH